MLYLILIGGTAGALLGLIDGLHVRGDQGVDHVEPIPPLSSLPPARPVAYSVSTIGREGLQCTRLTPERYQAWYALQRDSGVEWLAIARV